MLEAAGEYILVDKQKPTGDALDIAFFNKLVELLLYTITLSKKLELGQQDCPDLRKGHIIINRLGNDIFFIVITGL